MSSRHAAIGAVMVLALFGLTPAMAQQPATEQIPAGELLQRLSQSPFVLSDSSGKVLDQRRKGTGPAQPVTEGELIDALRTARLAPHQADSLWEALADLSNPGLVTLPIVQAMVTASRTPKTREAMWSELTGLSRELTRVETARYRDKSLLGLFERHRDQLLPLLTGIRETEGSSDETIELMQATKMFGATLDDSVIFVSGFNPGAIARYMERQRDLGKPVRWEKTAFEALQRWKDDHVAPRGTKLPRTFAEFDYTGETFVTIFNCLHGLGDKHREIMLRGLGPIELFNAVVAGEQELYRLGTSGYRNFLHSVIMKGIKDAGSFEAFLELAVPRHLGPDAVRASARRGMVFLRVVSSFGLLDATLETVRDRSRFIDDAIASLGDVQSFEANSLVVTGMLTSPGGTPAGQAFKDAPLVKLYARYKGEDSAALRSTYGSMLSVYQTITSDRREPGIDRDFPLDESMFRVPFERVFTRDTRGTYRHQMFMRVDENTDGVSTYAAFRLLMRLRGAVIREDRNSTVFALSAPGRAIEIHVNKPTAQGVRQGIGEIADALRGKQVHTVIGRGHTSIIPPLQSDSKRILGSKVKDVAAILVGTCGGDASVRELIGTFGYKPYFSTKATGRQVINNAIIEAYVAALKTLQPGARLSLSDVVSRATSPFLKPKIEDELRTDASLYHVNMTTVLTAILFDTHVRPHTKPDQFAARW